jgi:inhibitor of KinA sporulation pathway (predicted exonuclease)
MSDFYLVIDFEATCCNQGSVPREKMEIIEIGAVMVDAKTWTVVDEFQSFIRPVRYPQLTPFCTQLTSITQADVDGAPGFAEFVGNFKAWLYRYQDFVFCSWGDYDLHQLRQDCAFHRLPSPIGAPHRNVKRIMAERHNLAKKPGLGEAIRMVGLRFSGTAHRGIDDARNIARLLPWIFGDAVLGRR